MNPGYEVKPDHLSPNVWAKHSRYLNQYVEAVKNGNPKMWSVDQVAQFVWSIPDCRHVANYFKEQVSNHNRFSSPYNNKISLSLCCLLITIKFQYSEREF
jgi:hypothetical protein